MSAWGGSAAIYGGTISGNTADYGGGVSMEGKSVFNMYGGIISGNTANMMGGGVYVGGSSIFNMTGGVISGNKTTYDSANGGGVAVYYGDTFTMSGDAKIIGNTAANYLQYERRHHRWSGSC